MQLEFYMLITQNTVIINNTPDFHSIKCRQPVSHDQSWNEAELWHICLNQTNLCRITFLPLLLESFQASTKPKELLEEPVYTTLSEEFTSGCKVLHKADWIFTTITSVTQEILLPLPAICFMWGFKKFLNSSNFLFACVLSDFAETCHKEEPFSRLLFS